MYDIVIWGTIQYKGLLFYDGIFKGKTKGLDSFVYETPDGYTINENGTEEINGETYKTAVLAPNDNFMQI